MNKTAHNIKRMVKPSLAKYLLGCLLFFLCASVAQSQVAYPVQVYTQLTQPYTPHVAALYTGTQSKLKVTLINVDMNQPSVNVYLRMMITSSSFSMTTPVEVYTPAIELQAGVPLQLSHDDLAVYFKKENVRISGGQNEFFRTQLLPDNFYRFNFEVYEVATRKLVSNPKMGFAQAMIAAGEPPILNMPLKGASITESNIPSIFFTWTPRHMNSVAAAYGTEYEFTLVEIYDKQTAPENAFLYSRVLYTETVRSTSFIHSAAQPQLVPGMRYAWRVRAVAREGVEEANIFKNEGYSPISWFDYTIDCQPVQTTGVVIEGRVATVTWTEVDKAIDYQVEYRKKGTVKWYTGGIVDKACPIYNLKFGEEYEYRVGSRCLINDAFIYSETKAFRMPEELSKSKNCGIMPDLNVKNQEPATELIPLLPIMVGDFPVFVTKVSGSGRFTGEGYVGIPYLSGAQIAVTFKDITVNTDNRLISGYVETKYDPINNNMLIDVDEKFTGGQGVGDIRTGDEKADFEVNYSINSNIKAKPLVSDTSKLVLKENEEYKLTKGPNDTYQFVVVDSDNVEHTIESPTIPATIKDKDGSVFEVQENGDIVLVAKQSDVKLDDATKNKPRTDLATIRFEATDNTKYALDQYDDVYKKVTEYFLKYKRTDKEMVASAKFMLPGASDEIFVKLEKADAKFDVKKVRFVTGSGKEYTGVYDNSKKGWTLTLVGSEAGDGQELYVVVEEADGKFATLARLNIFSYEPKTINVKLVPVNGYAGIYTKEGISKELNEIYNKVGITCNVEIAPKGFNYTPINGKAFDVSGSGLFSKLTPDMKAINKAYLQANPDEKDICLFIIENVTGADGVVGDMPRASQFGYLFPNASVKTIAHEVGHGIFHLDHPHSRANAAKSFGEKDLLDNLMVYGNGTVLVKLQWDAIHAQGLVIGLFERDGDGMMAEENYIILDKDGLFFTPTGSPLPLKAGTKIFIPCLDYSLFPANWPVYNFETNLDGKARRYISHFTTPSTSGIDFLGYYNKDNSKDKYESPKKTIEGWGTFVVLKKGDDGNVYAVLMQDETFSTHYYTSNISVHSRNKPKCKELTEIDRSNSLYLAECDGISKAVASKDIEEEVVDNQHNKVVDFTRSFTLEEIQELLKKRLTYQEGTGHDMTIYIIDYLSQDYEKHLSIARADKNSIIFTINQSELSIEWLDISLPDAFVDAMSELGTKEGTNCWIDYVNASLDIARSTTDYKTLSDAKKISMELSVITFSGMIAPFKCGCTAKAMANKPPGIQFFGGVMDVNLDLLDLPQLVVGLLKLSEKALQAQFEAWVAYTKDMNSCLTEGSKGSVNEASTLERVFNTPASRVRNDIAKSIVEIGGHISFIFDDCDSSTENHGANICPYRYGQAAGIVVPIALSAGELALTHINKLRYAQLLKNFGRIEECTQLLKIAQEVKWAIERTGKTILIQNGDEIVATIAKSGKEAKITYHVGRNLDEAVFFSKLDPEVRRAFSKMPEAAQAEFLEKYLNASDDVLAELKQSLKLIDANSAVRLLTKEDLLRYPPFNEGEHAEHIEKTLKLYHNAQKSKSLEEWNILETYFRENKLNESSPGSNIFWPPANGGYNIKDNVSILKGDRLDRYQVNIWNKADEDLVFSGAFTAPIEGKPYSFEARSLANTEKDYVLYYEIEVLEDLPIKGQLADVIPWHGHKGGGKQINFMFDSNYKDFKSLIEDGYIKITVKESPGGFCKNKYVGQVITE